MRKKKSTFNRDGGAIIPAKFSDFLRAIMVLTKLHELEADYKGVKQLRPIWAAAKKVSRELGLK